MVDDNHVLVCPCPSWKWSKTHAEGRVVSKSAHDHCCGEKREVVVASGKWEKILELMPEKTSPKPGILRYGVEWANDTETQQNKLNLKEDPSF